MISGGLHSSMPASRATSVTVEDTIPEGEVILLTAEDETFDAEDIPVSYHNALILNDVSSGFKIIF